MTFKRKFLAGIVYGYRHGMPMSDLQWRYRSFHGAYRERLVKDANRQPYGVRWKNWQIYVPPGWTSFAHEDGRGGWRYHDVRNVMKITRWKSWR